MIDPCESTGRCAKAGVREAGPLTFLCCCCGQEVDRRSQRVPAAARLRTRATRPRKRRRYPTTSQERTRVNPAPLGVHPLARSGTWW